MAVAVMVLMVLLSYVAVRRVFPWPGGGSLTRGASWAVAVCLSGAVLLIFLEQGQVQSFVCQVTENILMPITGALSAMGFVWILQFIKEHLKPLAFWIK